MVFLRYVGICDHSYLFYVTKMIFTGAVNLHLTKNVASFSADVLYRISGFITGDDLVRVPGGDDHQVLELLAKISLDSIGDAFGRDHVEN